MIKIIPKASSSVNPKIKNPLTNNNTLTSFQPKIVEKHPNFIQFYPHFYEIYYSFINFCDRELDVFMMSVIYRHSNYGKDSCYISTHNYGNYLAGISKASACSALKRLTKNGLIVMVESSYRSNAYKLTNKSLEIIKTSQRGYLPDEFMTMDLSTLALTKRLFLSYLLNKYDQKLMMSIFERKLPQSEINFTESNLKASLIALKKLNLIEQVYSKDGYVRVRFIRDDIIKHDHKNYGHRLVNNNYALGEHNCNSDNLAFKAENNNRKNISYKNEPNINNTNKNKSKRGIFVVFDEENSKRFMVNLKNPYRLQDHELNFIRKGYNKFIPDQLIREEVDKLREILIKSGEFILEQKMFIYRAMCWMKKTYKNTVQKYLREYKNKVKSTKIYNILASKFLTNKTVFNILTPSVNEENMLAAQMFEVILNNIDRKLKNDLNYKEYLPSLFSYTQLIENIEDFRLENITENKQLLCIRFGHNYIIKQEYINSLSRELGIEIKATQSTKLDPNDHREIIKRRLIDTYGYIPEEMKTRFGIDDEQEVETKFIPTIISHLVKNLKTIFNTNRLLCL